MSDFGDGKWVVGRKDHRCEACLWVIPDKESHYQFKGMYDGEWQNWRMHRECYDAYYADDCGEFMPGDFPVPERFKKAVAWRYGIL